MPTDLPWTRPDELAPGHTVTRCAYLPCEWECSCGIARNDRVEDPGEHLETTALGVPVEGTHTPAPRKDQP